MNGIQTNGRYLVRFIEVDGETFRVTHGPSIFSNRQNSADIRVARRGDWGAMAEDGHRYRTIRTFAVESRDRLGYCDGVLPADFPLESIFATDFFNEQVAA